MSLFKLNSTEKGGEAPNPNSGLDESLGQVICFAGPPQRVGLRCEQKPWPGSAPAQTKQLFHLPQVVLGEEQIQPWANLAACKLASQFVLETR